MRHLSVLVKPVVAVGCLGLVTACGGPANTRQTSGSSGPGRLSLTSGGLTPTCTPGQTQAQVYSGYGTGRTTPSIGGFRAAPARPDYALAGYRVPANGLLLAYDGSRAPQEVGRQGWDATLRAGAVWAKATAPRDLLKLVSAPQSVPAAATRDGHSTITWGRLDSGKPDEVTRLVVWFSDGKLLEADCLLNTLVPWRVNPPVEGTGDLSGAPDAYDVQAAVTRLLGHVLGLGPPAPDGREGDGETTAAATFNPLGLGDCSGQALTAGELRGALAATPDQG